MTTNPSPTPKPSIPPFPCPKCGADLLAAGFYNSCSETQRLREDNYPIIVGDVMYLEHNEDNYETVDHECDVEAFCTSCGTQLPWALFVVRGELDGINIANANAAISKLLAEQEDGASKSANA